MQEKNANLLKCHNDSIKKLFYYPDYMYGFYVSKLKKTITNHSVRDKISVLKKNFSPQDQKSAFFG